MITYANGSNGKNLHPQRFGIVLGEWCTRLTLPELTERNHHDRKLLLHFSRSSNDGKEVKKLEFVTVYDDKLHQQRAAKLP